MRVNDHRSPSDTLMHSERYSCRSACLLYAEVTDERGPTCQGQSMAASSYVLPASAAATPVRYDCYLLRTQQAFRRDHSEPAAVSLRTAALRDPWKSWVRW